MPQVSRLEHRRTFRDVRTSSGYVQTPSHIRRTFNEHVNVPRTFLELKFFLVEYTNAVQYKLQKEVRVKTIYSKDNSSDVVLQE